MEQAQRNDEDIIATIKHLSETASQYYPLVLLSCLVISYFVVGGSRWEKADRLKNTFHTWIRMSLYYMVILVATLLLWEVTRAFLQKNWVWWLGVLFLIFWLKGFVTMLNLFLTAFSYIYTFLASWADIATAPESNWVLQMLDIRWIRYLKEYVGACEFTTGTSPKTTNMRTTPRIGEQWQENVAAKLQFSVEKNADSSKEDWGETPWVATAIDWVLKGVTRWSVGDITACVKLGFMKLVSNMAGFTMADHLYNSALEYSLPPHRPVSEPHYASVGQYMYNSGVFCSKESWVTFISKKDIYNDVLTLTGRKAAYNKLGQNRVREIMKMAKKLDPGDQKKTMISLKFIESLDEADELKQSSEEYGQEMNERIFQWFRFDRMDFYLMKRMGMKTSHLEARAATASPGETATAEEIDEALGTDNPSVKRDIETNFDNVPSGAINCGEKRNTEHDCCTAKPGPPDFSGDDGYHYQLEEREGRFFRKIQQQSGQET